MTTTPVISVIVPVYNTEKWLRRCVDSILVQTYTDFELLLIDDGSIDGSGTICDEYAIKDSRIRVFHKSNGGVSSARNVGLDQAKGEWVSFIDADDWIDADTFESYLKLEESGINLLFGGHKNHYADQSIEIKRLPSAIVDNTNFDKYYSEYDFHWRTSPWAKFYRKSTIDDLGLRFDPKMKIGEDALFLFRFMLHEGKFKIVPVAAYNYNFEITSSLTKKIYDYNQELYFYQNISPLIADLRASYSLKSKDSTTKLDWVLGYYIGRILNSLYLTLSLSRKKRIDIIKHLDIEPFLRGIAASNSKEKLLNMILKNKLFTLYDYLRVIKKRL